MAVSLDKTPRLRLFIAVVSNVGTDSARVHHMGRTNDSFYDYYVTAAWAVKDTIPGSTVHLVVAGDQAAAFRQALVGDSADELINPFFLSPVGNLPA